MLGFRPAPSPEAHTRITDPEQQSYFLPYAEALDLGIPVLLVGATATWSGWRPSCAGEM